ncbi:MAG TPA: alpha/beta hydrolase [Actinomycetota bacterium]|nr:alpha/beta hydrolase [Actinomycetota bacterium]
MALHQVMDGDGDAVLIGHDWGAETAYAAAAFAPGRWRRVVTLGVPPPGLDRVLFGDYQQLKRFFYLFMFRDSLERAVEVVAADGLAFLDRLWQDWSPGLDGSEVLEQAKESMRQPANLAAAISYYRDATVVARPDKAEQAAGRPTLYLDGGTDGCIAADLVAEAERMLPPRLTDDPGPGCRSLPAPREARGGQPPHPLLDHQLEDQNRCVRPGRGRPGRRLTGGGPGRATSGRWPGWRWWR